MVYFNIANTELWKNKETDVETFNFVMNPIRGSDSKFSFEIITIFGTWTTANRMRKYRSGLVSDIEDFIIVDDELIDEFFKDEDYGAHVLFIDMDEEQEKKLKKALHFLVGAKFS